MNTDPIRRAKFVGLHGHSGVGKDAAARTMPGYLAFSIGDRIREALERQNPRVAGSLRVADLVDLYGWDVAKRNRVYGPEMRRLMQETGQMAVEFFGEDVWIKRLEKVIHQRVVREQPFGIIITDIRLPIEAEWVHGKGGVVFKMTRTGVSPVNDHITEQPIPDELIDAHVANDGTREELAETLALLTGNPRPARIAAPVPHLTSVPTHIASVA